MTLRTLSPLLLALGLIFAGCGDDDGGTTGTTPMDMDTPMEMNIVETAQALTADTTNGLSFATLLSVATDAGLAGTLSTTENITVFAPTDEAFADISDIVAGLTPEQVDSVLRYHVLPSVARAADLSNTTLTMFSGEDAVVSIDTTPPTIAGAEITVTDVEASNGVIHVVTSVLIPPTLRP